MCVRWPLELTLDGDFTDTAAGAVFNAERAAGFAPANRVRGGDNQSYGPTGQTTQNGAVAPGLTTLPTANGLTFEGWFLKAGNNGRCRLPMAGATGDGTLGGMNLALPQPISEREAWTAGLAAWPWLGSAGRYRSSQ